MKATDVIIMYSHDDIPDYAEHYDMVDGKLMNAKPVTKDFFVMLKANGQEEYQKIPPELILINNGSKVFYVKGKERLIKLAIESGEISGILMMPNLLFDVNIFDKKIIVNMVIKNKLYAAPFPNITNDSLCTGNVHDSENIFTMNYVDMIKAVKHIFFNSRFSSHYDSTIFNAMKEAIENNNKNYIPDEYLSTEKINKTRHNPF